MSDYYKPEHLAKFAAIDESNKELAQKFFGYYQAVLADGALSAREKALELLLTPSYGIKNVATVA